MLLILTVFHKQCVAGEKKNIDKIITVNTEKTK